MNLSADPCNDFYNYACGQWLADNHIPSSRSRWARSFDTLQNQTEYLERAINEDGWPLIGDFYASCMNETALDVAGTAPIQTLLAQIGAINSTADLTAALAALHAVGVDPLFSFSSGVDDKNPNRTIALFDQGGLDLPQAVYGKNDTDSLTQLNALQTFASTLFSLLDAPYNATAAASAAFVLQLEAQLANISLTNEQRRSPTVTYNKVGLAQLQNWTTTFNFTAYTDAVGVRAGWNTSEVNVQSPKFYQSLDAVLSSQLQFGVNANTTAPIRAFLTFKYVSSFAGLLSKPFRDAAFNYSAALTGVDAPPPRYRTCLSVADSTALGELVGHYFVTENFKAATKVAAKEMVRAVEEAFGKRMHDVKWLANSTAALDAAENKLSLITNKIGYPDSWRKFTGVTITTSYADNIVLLTRLSTSEDAAQVDSETNKAVWGMNPQTINAYYQPVFNEIVFPAAILQGSFYNPDAPGALNFGSIGGVVGHEISHGFDDQGRQYDAEGRLRPWWPPSVVQGFEEAAACVVNLYSNFTVQAGNDTVHCNGNTTLGENLADLGGIANAFRAYVARLANDTAFAATEAQIPQAFHGLSGHQLYFVAWGQNWCTLQTPQSIKRQIATDPHSPAEIRVLGPTSQFDEFGKAFNCKPGDKYSPVDRCSVW